ncbi:MAG: response regulator [Proteobacteria bacterium]|nr:response regulator [Pseudomonadota bacterium]
MEETVRIVDKEDLPNVAVFDRAIDVVSAPDPSSPPRFGRPYILVVDDDPVVSQVLVNTLDRAEYRVAVARNGLEALEILESDPDIDLMLLDVMMPELNGYQVCKKVRRQYDAGQLPVLMLTARTQPEDVIAGLEAGANDYLIKPVNQKEMLARIRTHLEVKESFRRLKENETLRGEIAKRKRAEQKLESSQRRLVRILDTAENAILVFNGENRITFVNRKAENLFGYSIQEMLGEALDRFFVDEPPTLDRQGGEVTVRRKNGRQTTATAFLVLLEEESGLVFKETVESDIGEPKDEARLAVVPDGSGNSPFPKELWRLETTMAAAEDWLFQGDAGLLREVRELPHALDEVGTVVEEVGGVLVVRNALVEAMSLALRYWIQTTNRTKVELAEESGIWKTYVDRHGTYSTRTLDRYLTEQTLPRKPRWRPVLQTVYFVLQSCPRKAPVLKKELEKRVADLESLLRR